MTSRLRHSLAEDLHPDRPLLPASLGEVCAQCGRHHDEHYGEDCPWISPGDGTDADGPAAPGIPRMVSAATTPARASMIAFSD